MKSVLNWVSAVMVGAAAGLALSALQNTLPKPYFRIGLVVLVGGFVVSGLIQGWRYLQTLWESDGEE